MGIASWGIFHIFRLFWMNHRLVVTYQMNCGIGDTRENQNANQDCGCFSDLLMNSCEVTLRMVCREPAFKLPPRLLQVRLLVKGIHHRFQLVLGVGFRMFLHVLKARNIGSVSGVVVSAFLTALVC